MLRTVATAAMAAVAFCSLARAADLDANTCSLPSDAEARQQCLCVVALPLEAKSPVALLNEIKGDVLKSGQSGFSPVAKTTALSVGDKVILAANGQGVLTAGASCSHVVGPDASLVVTDIGDNCACAALEQKKAAVVAPADPGLAAALGIGATVGLIALSHHPSSVSP